LIVLQWVVLTVMFIGEAGLVTTIIPGLTVIWLSALVYWLVAGFNLVNGFVFGAMTVLMVVGNLADNFIMGATARQGGASWLAIFLALAGGVVGTLVWPPFGGLAMALLLVFAVEFYRRRNWRQALRSMGDMAAGCGWSVVVRLLIGAIMILLWLIAVFALGGV
ncbi:MAG: DUF456 domain-containing protein, partial [Anaerolineaceae bacterium]|nr:DUF456 domain-containing protein [Anaerolineaceae bacterium]